MSGLPGQNWYLHITRYSRHINFYTLKQVKFTLPVMAGRFTAALFVRTGQTDTKDTRTRYVDKSGVHVHPESVFIFAGICIRLLAAVDGHAKNFSLFIEPKSVYRMISCTICCRRIP
ncbi:hypothetical protein [Zobellella denitrificans]|uniref:hypothetical protein n=1 Tax=Zobellella denitrificans TaxID=347534 RepID=UPI0012FD5136|nr:hypothetical protein [Zobellella denitrificans]